MDNPALTRRLYRSAKLHQSTLLAVGVVVPILVAVVTVAHASWWPTSDLALTYLRTTDVGTAHTPLVGAYSRYYFNHPGPIMFYVFAPFVQWLGPVGMFVAAGLLNAASIVGAILVGRRRLGLWGSVLVATGCLLLLRSLSPAVAVDPWNPWTPMFPFLFAAVCQWAVCEGDVRLLPWSVAAGTFAVQTHIGYAPLIAVLAVAPVVVLVARHRTASLLVVRRHRSSIITAVVVGVLLWIPTVVQQVRGDPGNYVAIWRNMLGTSGPSMGLAAWLKVFSAQISPLGPWSTGGSQMSDTTLGSPSATIVWGGVVLVSVIGLGVAASRHGNRAPLRFAIYTVVLCGTGILAMTRIRDAPFPYLFRWVYVLVALVWMSITASVTLILVHAWPRLRSIAHRIRPLAVTGLVVFALALAPSAAATSMPARAKGQQVERLADLVAPHLDRSLRYEVRWIDTRPMEGRGIGFIAALDHLGFTVLQPWSRIAPFQVGTNRVVRHSDDVDAVLEVRGFTRATVDVRDVAVPEGQRVIVASDSRSAVELRRIGDLTDERTELRRRLKEIPHAASEEAGLTILQLAAIGGEIEELPDAYVVTVGPPG